MNRSTIESLWSCANAIAGPSRIIRNAHVRPTSRPIRAIQTPRHLSTTSSILYPTTLPPTPSPANPNPHPAFETLSTSLSSTQPCFGARGDEITILNTPEQFYKLLLDMIKRAKKRILISSLYIGAEEGELVEAIKHALATRPHLRVTIILDYHRATRLSTSTSTTTPPEYPPSTAHLLLPLLEKHSDRCEVWLFRSPKLKGIMERIVPARFDEGWGTWHAKWHGVDDEVIISGANLANSYFTNRQDRYIHFASHPTLLSYLSSLTRLFTHYSYLLSPSPPPSISRLHLVPLPSPNPSTSLSQFFTPASLVWPTPSVHPRHFKPHAQATLTAFQKSWKATNASRLRRVDVDTWFWPVIQAGVLGITEEEDALGRVLGCVNEVYAGKEEDRVGVDLTSGYFGLFREYKKAVVGSQAPFRVIAASPRANGFYGSAGLSRLIPEAYTLLESRFWHDVQNRGRGWQNLTGVGVRLKEWEREGWTYHAKGIWVSPTISPNHPFMTFIGSSNLSTRSLTLDTELSLLLTTSSPSLRRALAAEVKNLDKHTIVVGKETWELPERRVSALTKVLTALGVEGML